MKQLLVIAVALASVNAFATRARMTALGNSPHLIDTTTVYSNPSDVFRVGGDYVTLETGATGGVAQTAQNANAEGAIVRTHGDAKLGLSLGHQETNASSWGLRGAASVAALKANQQNPIEFLYGAKMGDMNWAASLVYSNYNDKAAAVGALEKESSMGVKWGFNNATWDGDVRVGLTNTANLMTGNKFTGTTGIGADLGYSMDTMYISGSVVMAGFKEESAAGADVQKVTTSNYMLSATNSMKKDGSEFFYGVGLNMTDSSETVSDTKQTSTSLPVWIGLEVDANSWLTFRGSVTQSTLINNAKNTTAGTTTLETAPGANSTTVAAGAGLKFNKLTLDGTLSTATTQTINTTNLLAQVGVSYWF